jgi:hypothetical protein
MRIPDTKNIFEVIYRYKDREFYLAGEDVKTFLSQLGGASILSVTHGMTFKPLNWKVRKIEVKK